MSKTVHQDPATIPITTLPGVGPVRAERLARLGLHCLRDVLLFVPRRLDIYEELESLAGIEALIGRRVRVSGLVKSMSMFRRGWKQSVLRIRLEEDSEHLDLVFYNQGWMRKRFERGDRIRCEGLLVSSKGAAIVAPRLIEKADEPNEPSVIYPLTEGIGQAYLRKLCRGVSEEWANCLEEPLCMEKLAEVALPGLAQATQAVHRPTSADSFRAARRRLALEPLLVLQARLLERRNKRTVGRAASVRALKKEIEEVLGLFPAPFTPGQRAVVEEITLELSSTVPMRRLLQGDVGSGKTWVAAFAAALVARSGKQVALMAPTELLAEQHAMGLIPLFKTLGLRAVLLTGSLDTPKARRIREDLATGKAQIAIGTHALVSESTRFQNLALAIVDEQHRFGVSQRERLFEKGRDVHALLMTATPIPRTLALTIYGDLETSLLKDRPPGRSTIGTRRVLPEKHEAMCDFLVERMKAGERVFWVAPRIDGEKGAEVAFDVWTQRLANTALNVELVHGRLAAEKRVERLDRFRSGASQLLVGTTVIEVGVDVSEATVIVIDGAEHLGLSQLHQIRGRVGRGSAKSWCFLLGDESAIERMEALVQTSDGFEIAELDLLQRGMGSLTGARQAGANDEGLENPEADLDLVLLARDLVEADPELCSRYAALPFENESID